MADNRLITDSKAGGNRIKAASQEGQAGRDVKDKLEKEKLYQEKEARRLK